MLGFRLVIVSSYFLTSISAANAPDSAAIERGRKEFVQSCGFCHGNDATGSRAPDLIRSPLLSHDVNGDAIGPVIRNGRPEKEMPAFPKANVADIAAFLHAQAAAALHSARVPHDYPLAKLLTGDAAAGKAYFSTKCAACHSAAGDLKAIAKRYSPIDLQSRFLYPAERGAHPLATAVITLPDGAKIEGRVEHIDEFTIAVVGSDGWYRSYDRSRVRSEVSDPLAAHRELLHQYTDKDVHDIFAYLETLQ